MKIKSLRSRPGAMKRKEKVERMERERFGRNLAVVMGTAAGGDGDVRTEVTESAVTSATNPIARQGRFAAMKAWVETNMEKHPGFEKAKQ